MNIEVKVIAGARKREIKAEGSRLRVKVAARPVDGKANEELIACVAEAFGVKRGLVRILAGEKETRKVLSIPLEEDEFRRVLESLS